MKPLTLPFGSALPTQRLLLVGGGHSHIHVLRRRMMRPEEGAHLAVTLIAREVHTPYSGMLPGRVAGLYGPDEMHIDLARLCRAADTSLVLDEVVALDLAAKAVSSRGHPAMRFDILSLNSGAEPGFAGVDVSAPVMPVKPIGRFLTAWAELRTGLESALDRGEARSLAVVGAGAGGVELILSIARQMSGVPAGLLSLTLVEAGAVILPGHNGRVRRWAERQLAAAGIRILKGFQVEKVTSEGLFGRAGEHVEVDHTLWTTGVCAPAYPQDSGLQVDASGFVNVNRSLQSLSHPCVFAAGDMANLVEQPRAKSGVYAVRAGPVLAENLLRYARGVPLKPFRAQRRALAILGNARGSAVASRGWLFAAGKPVWWLKQFIDRRFMARFTPPDMSEALGESAVDQALMRCAGCGSKLPASLLTRVLERLDVHPDEQVLQGIGEDAAMLQIGTHTQKGTHTGPEEGTHTTRPGTHTHPEQGTHTDVTPSGTSGKGTHTEQGTHTNPEKGTHTLCVSTDHFPQMVSDTYLFGRIAAHHGLSDLFAMGARPRYALVNLNVKLMAANLMEDEAELALKGANDVFRECGVTLVGGHSTESETTALGCTVIGDAEAPLLVKSGLVEGEMLVLTKPLGVGVLLAGEMRRRTLGRWLEAALEVMDQSNGPGVRALRAHGAASCTDVTGFGLLGHLLEMLRASEVAAELWLDQVPRLDGAVELMASGVESSLQSANESALAEVEVSGLPLTDPALRLLMDPQTCGGLLVGIAPARAETLLGALGECGYECAAIIGKVIAPSAPARVRIVRSG